MALDPSYEPRGPWLVPVCPDCGRAGEHSRTCTMFPLKPVVHGNYVNVVPEAEVERLREAAGSLLEILDRDGVMDWHELDDARQRLREVLDG